MKNYESLTNAHDDLKKRGYNADFESQTICLYCGDFNIRLDPEEFTIDESYRFEGESDPGDSTIIYAITSSNGVKGTLVEAYGTYSENLDADMARKFQGHLA